MMNVTLKHTKRKTKLHNSGHSLSPSYDHSFKYYSFANSKHPRTLAYHEITTEMMFIESLLDHLHDSSWDLDEILRNHSDYIRQSQRPRHSARHHRGWTSPRPETSDPRYPAYLMGPPPRNPRNSSPSPHQYCLNTPPRRTISPTNRPSATEQFTTQFPYGFHLIPTSGSGKLCGLRALRNSIEAQFAADILEVPRLTHLQEIMQSAEITDFEHHTGSQVRDNTNNFYVDQLGAIWRIWGRWNELDLQLGYVLSDGRAFLVPGPTTRETRVVWIASDSRTGGDGGSQHYEGLRARERRRRRSRSAGRSWYSFIGL
jgi:hypothetical protein